MRAFAGNVSGDLKNSIDVTTGTIINPHTALIFDGVGLKSFTFDWQFSPKNEDEHKTLTNIIKKIKTHILPNYKTPVGNVASNP